jgi:hypothetical protein
MISCGFVVFDTQVGLVIFAVRSFGGEDCVRMSGLVF